ncbi:MAG: ECF-type sigma factor [Vicinamibacterales bacterium]
MERGRGPRRGTAPGIDVDVAAGASRLLRRAAGGDADAASRLMPLVYDELRRLAAGYLRRERRGQTLQPTALVHEAYVRLVRPSGQAWQGRTHFLAIAAVSMRQILVDRARRRHAAKRGGDAVRLTLDEAMLPADSRGAEVDLLALDRALDALAALDPAQARIVELRYFGGLTVEETADAVGLSPATVKRHWALARAFLKRTLDGA